MTHHRHGHTHLRECGRGRGHGHGDVPAPVRALGRVALGSMLVFTGTSHLTWARREFRAQVPDAIPLDPDTTVLASGVVEVALGSALAVAPVRYRRTLGVVAAAFFVAVFPGNVSQFVHRRDGFGLDSDARRLTRLFLQPVLVWWALASTRA